MSALPTTSLTGALRALYAQLTPRRRRQLWMVFGVMLIGAATEMVTLGAVFAFLKVMADPVAAGRAAERFAPILHAIGLDVLAASAILLGVVAVAAGAVRLLLTWQTQWVVLSIGHDLATEVFGRALRQPYAHYITRSSSQLISGMEKVQRTTSNVVLPALQGIVAAIMAAAITGVFISIDPVTMALLAASVVGLYAVIGRFTSGRLRRNSGRLSKMMVARTAAVQEGFGGIRDILLQGSQRVFEARFSTLDATYRRAQAVNGFLATAPRHVVETFGILFIAALVIAVGRRPDGLAGAIPLLGLIALGAQRILPLTQQAYSGWSTSRGNLHALFDALELARAPVLSTPVDAPAVPFASEITFDHVSFTYPDGRVALRGISLAIPAGARIGVAGRTGSGKSSFLDLLMGLLEPGGGRILVDGQSLDDAARAGWQANIAHVPQRIYLAEASIAANIAFGVADDAFDIERVRWAGRIAELDRFVGTLPDGYDTPVGENGISLSGGQRQRIGIARALYGDASVLILDEATSALDEPTEHRIMTRLAHELGGMTLIVVAHRASAFALVEEMVTFENGRITTTSVPHPRAQDI